MSLSMLEEILNNLLIVVFNKDVNILVPDSTTLIKEVCALESYYTLLTYLLNKCSYSKETLLPYILYPLHRTTDSTYNCRIIASVYSYILNRLKYHDYLLSLHFPLICLIHANIFQAK